VNDIGKEVGESCCSNVERDIFTSYLFTHISSDPQNNFHLTTAANVMNKWRIHGLSNTCCCHHCFNLF